MFIINLPNLLANFFLSLATVLAAFLLTLRLRLRGDAPAVFLRLKLLLDGENRRPAGRFRF